MRFRRAEGRIRIVIIPAARLVPGMTNGSDASLNSPTRAPRIPRARRAGKWRGLRPIVSTAWDSSTPSHPFEPGSAGAATKRRRLALAYTLLEGFEKGNLQLCPPECKWSCLSNSCETTASPETGIE